MPPSTLKVRNGSPATASTAASQTQILVATTSPSLAPSRSELCLPISPPRPGRMHAALGKDLRDAREGLPGCVGDVVPAVGSRPAHPVVERFGARADRSEEHTSQLQSRGHLVCRLLLEKKNNIHFTSTLPV